MKKKPTDHPLVNFTSANIVGQNLDLIQDNVQQVSEILTRQFTADEIKKLKKGKKKNPTSGVWEDLYLDYIEGHSVIERLNEAFTPLGWSFAANQVEYSEDRKQVAVYGELHVQTPWGTPAIKGQWGSADIKEIDSKESNDKKIMDFGNDIKAAATDCLKKCATLFGVGLHLQRKAISPTKLETKDLVKKLNDIREQKNLSIPEMLEYFGGIFGKTITTSGDMTLSQVQRGIAALELLPEPKVDQKV